MLLMAQAALLDMPGCGGHEELVQHRVATPTPGASAMMANVDSSRVTVYLGTNKRG